MDNPKFQIVDYVPNAPPVNEDEMMKMYVLINRPVLTLVQAGVQAAHSMTEYTIKHPTCEKYKEWATKHKTLIFLQSNEYEMRNMIKGLDTLGIKHAKFCEPDMFDENKSKVLDEDGVFTALAIEPMGSYKGKVLFGKFSLLK